MQKKLTVDIMTKSKGGDVSAQSAGAVQGGRHAAGGGGGGKSVKGGSAPGPMTGVSGKDKISPSDRKTAGSYSEAL